MSWISPRSVDGGLDEIPLTELGVVGAGSIWLCGKVVTGTDVEAAMARADDAAAVICLCERHELSDRYPDYVAWLESDARARWMPIPDLHAPDGETAVAVVTSIASAVMSGQSVIVHCAAGLGRAPTMAMSAMVALGADPADAAQLVAARRPLAGPEVGAQQDLIDAFASGRLVLPADR